MGKPAASTIGQKARIKFTLFRQDYIFCLFFCLDAKETIPIAIGAWEIRQWA
jgi:hypothetical protein